MTASDERASASDERMARFKADVADLRLSTGRADLERVLAIVALVVMVAGVAVALVAYAGSLNQHDSRDVQSSLILAVAMLGAVVVGAALFLRYSLARFLRLWLLRQLYEGQAHVEQVVEALAPERDA